MTHRVLFVAPSGAFRGGVERHLHDLGAALVERGHRVAVAIPATAPRDPTFLAPFDDVVDLAGLQRAARPFDVVYAHKPIEAEALVEVGSSACPVVVAVHDHDLTCVRAHRYLPVGHAPCHAAPGVGCITRGCCVVRSQGPLGVALRSPFALRSALLRLAEVATFVTASRYLAERLHDAGVAPDRVEVIHPATRDAPTPLRPTPTRPRLAFAGQIVRGKGLDVLLDALVEVRADLVVAGDGPGRADAEDRARRLGVGDRVRFLGAVAPRAMIDVYDAARVVVVPSRWPEPFGMVGVEAMRRRRVVVAARHGGVPEWLAEGRAGYGFEPTDARDLARTLRRALAASDHEARADVGLALAAERFSFEGMVARVESALGARARDASSSSSSVEARP